jgi:hypothetical protein
VIITSTGMHEPILDRHLFEPVLILEKRFGANYINYKEKVRRWL